MLRKELTESIKRLLECCVIFVGIPIAFLLDRLIINFGWEFKDLFQGIIIAVVLIYTVYSGLTLFQSEKRDRAFEYLLSMPISKSKIILLKIVARLISLLFLILILTFLMDFNTFQGSAVWLIFLFFISVSFSIVIDSIILGFIGVSLIFQVYVLNSNVLHFVISKTNIEGSLDHLAFLIPALSALLFLIPFGISFWLTFKKMDLKPLKLQIKPYYYIAFPALCAIVIFILINYRDHMIWLQNK